MENFQNAVNNLVIGLGDKLTDNQKWELTYIKDVINNLKQLREVDTYYIYALPKPFVEKFLIGQHLINSWHRKCVIKECHFVNEKNDYCLNVGWEKGDKRWQMWLRTTILDCRWIDLKQKVYLKYFSKLTPGRVDSLITYLEQKKEAYDKWYKNSTRRSNNIIGRELSKHTNDMVVSRSAIRQSIRSIQKDSKVIADAFNSTLSQSEQQTLINWLAANVYSMRLYVVKDSRWDKAISELYPEEVYGKHRQTIPSELSKDSINGYISVNSLANIPYDILKKVTHKEKDEDVVKQNKGSSKFRINNYLLVLYLLNNYNKNGFKLGITNLNKGITL